MNGSLDPEERILDKPTINELVAGYVEKLGWSVDDEITVELGGTQISGIDVGEEYNRKWQSPIGTRSIIKIVSSLSKTNHVETSPNHNL